MSGTTTGTSGTSTPSDKSQTPGPSSTQGESNPSTSTTDGNNSGNARSNRKNVYVDTSNQKFEGAQPSVNAVLGVKLERMDLKVSFDAFRDKIENFILQNYKNGDFVIPVVRDMKDPLPIYKATKKPTSFSEEELEDPVNAGIQQQKIKNYVLQEAELESNLNKVYALIWGQCSSNLQALIRHLKEYKAKSQKYDVLWLLENLKKLTSGIDVKANKHVVLHDKLLQFLTMRQGATESNDNYLKRYNSNLQTLELAGGEHIFCSPQLTDKSIDTMSDDEIKEEEDKFKAVCLLQRSDPERYDDLCNDLQKGSYLGRDEYPTDPSMTFDLMVRTSKIVNTSTGNGGRARGGRGGRGGTNGGRGQAGRDDVRVVFAQRGANQKEVRGVDGTLVERTCWNCQNWGHLSNNCPEAPRGGRTGTTMFHRCMSQLLGDIPSTWIILDTASTLSCAHNFELVTNVRKCDPGNEITALTNGGSKHFDKEADLKLLPIKMAMNPTSMANIVSMKDVTSLQGVKVVMDSTVERAIFVHYNEQVLKFQECHDGLYFYDTEGATIKNNKEEVTNYSLLSTVSNNKKFFSSDEIKRAELARNIQQLIGWPSLSTFKRIVSSNLLRNCPITIDDINRAEIIFGTPSPLLKGKMIKPSSIKVKIEKIPLPLPISKYHQRLQLYIDIFYVNKIPFFHTKSGKVKFITSQSLPSKVGSEIEDGLTFVLDLYKKRGFQITDIHGDNEFNITSLKKMLAPIADLHLCAKGEHVPIIERSIRTVKERCRCGCHSLPYRRYTKLMTISLVEGMTTWLNAFAMPSGISSTMSPAAIVTGKNSPDMNLKRISFGSYAMVYIGTQNNMKRRGVPAIALRESNEAGGHYFMSLYTGKELHSNSWDELPIDDEVIAKVDALALAEKQPLLPDSYPLFEWSPGLTIDDIDLVEDIEEIDGNENDEDFFEIVNNDNENEVNDDGNNNEEFIADDSASSDTNDESSDSSEDANNDNDIIHNRNINAIESDSSSDNSSRVRFAEPADVNDDREHDLSYSDSDNDDHYESHANTISMDDESDLSLDSEERSSFVFEERGHAEDETEEQPNQSLESIFEEEKSSASIPSHPPDISNDDNEVMPSIAAPLPSFRRSTRQSVRPEQLFMDPVGKSYTNHRQFLQQNRRVKLTHRLFMQHARKMDERNGTYKNIANNVIFNQMTAKRGMKLFGERAVAAMFKEYKQLNEGAVPGKPVLGPIDPDTLTPADRQQALEAVNLIKEKRDGKIKGRTCANGSEQKKFLKEDESVASPTCSVESLMSTLIIDAYEGRDIAIYDVPGAFLQSDIPKNKKILMIIRGDFVDIMCEVNPEYEQYVRTDKKGRKYLYVRVLQAIYGCIESALLWYNLYSSTLEKEGFTLNPYDKCVANKMINGKQCTIVFYVDDNKISHVDEEVVTDVINMVKGYFGELVVTRGKEHTFLGMKIKVRDDKKIEISMEDQQLEAIALMENTGEKVKASMTTPAAKHLYMCNDNEKLLDEKRSEIFHSIAAKILFITKRVRPDFEPTTAYFCTRVSKSNEDDWKKLKRALGYMKGTYTQPRIIGATSIKDLYTWVDAAYAVHPNMRGQTGGVMSMGIGILHGRSSKQKLNTKSSTESELVGVSEYIPFNLFIINFLSEQGYKIENNLLYQDNQSAIRMEKNGRNSCTGNSRHIDVRYFFVKDRIDKKEIKVEYCPTEQMLADFFTKPLQGGLFRKFRDVIMGRKPITDLYSFDNLQIKERVENKMRSTENVTAEISQIQNNGKLTYADILRGERGV